MLIAGLVVLAVGMVAAGALLRDLLVANQESGPELPGAVAAAVPDAGTAPTVPQPGAYDRPQPPALVGTPQAGGVNTGAGSRATQPIGERLLRRYPYQLYASSSGSRSAFEWIDIEGRAVPVTAEADANRRLTLLMNGARVISHQCGRGTCTVAINQREDGKLLVRFKDDAVTVVLLYAGQTEQQRWLGRDVPTLNGEEDAAIPLEPLPVVRCAGATDCAERSAAVWRAKNHRYAIAYALASGPHASTVYTLASAYASAGDAERAGHYLAGAPDRMWRRAESDRDFDPVRDALFGGAEDFDFGDR